MEAFADVGQPIEHLIDLAESKADPHDWRLVTDNAVGVRHTPLATRNCARMGTRQRVLETAQRHPHRLGVELDALVTRVHEHNRATGVEYLIGDPLSRIRPAHNGQRQAPTGAGRPRGHPQRWCIQYTTDVMPSGIGSRAMLEPLGSRRGWTCGVSARTFRTARRGVVNRMNFERWNVLGVRSRTCSALASSGVSGDIPQLLFICRHQAELPDLGDP